MKLELGKYSLGMGDRFAHQAKAQLRACLQAAEAGLRLIPVWNKSQREHLTIGSQPASVREAAEEAIRALGWTDPYHVDADHIRLDTVDGFLACSDFFTLDVADSIGQAAEPEAVEGFVRRQASLLDVREVPGLDVPLQIRAEDLQGIAARYLKATQEAGRIYRHIAAAKGEGTFITEVSMDETQAPQTPPELLVILAALAEEQIPLQTIAPKFTGRFNKGIDYAGEADQLEKEFNADLAVIAFAVAEFGLPQNLKLSVHSGSDKFSIYGPIRRAMARSGAGLHLKTAGTTWLEELIGLAEAGGEGLVLAKQIYAQALEHREALCTPYAAVIDIDPARLPEASAIQHWSAEQFVGALRHDPAHPLFNPHLRQLLHVGYKIAAKMGARYLAMLDACQDSIARNVTVNLYERHVRPLFLTPP